MAVNLLPIGETITFSQMPLLSSFRPYRYNPSTVLDAGAVIAPPYDVISPEKRRALLERDPRNVIQLILPEGDESSRYAHADELLREWIAGGALIREEEPARDPVHAIAAGSDVHAALATLSPRERTCVVLRYFDDLTVPQISRHLGIAEGSVKRYLADAVGRLQLALGDIEAEDETTIVQPPKGSSGGNQS